MTRPRKPPVVDRFERPETMPVPVLLRAAADGLRAIGQRRHAETIEATVGDYPEQQRALEAVGRHALDIESAYEAAGLEDWATAVTQIAALLRGALYRRAA